MLIQGRVLHRIVLLILSSLFIAACSQKQADEPVASVETAASTEAVGSIAKYDWYMQGTTPAGQTTITKNGDGKITNESFVHWNNREWTVNSELQLDANGRIESQKITGISPFKSVIDEYYTYEDGVASWGTPGESGSATTDEPAFYLANEGITFGAAGALVKAAVNSIDSSIDLFPNGRARVEKVRDVTVDTPDGEQLVSLFAIQVSASRRAICGSTRNWMSFHSTVVAISVWFPKVGTYLSSMN
jgi:hypothetical protein